MIHVLKKELTLVNVKPAGNARRFPEKNWPHFLPIMAEGSS
jgi:hypothetical protein